MEIREFTRERLEDVLAFERALREELKARGVHVLIALTAANSEAQRFYRALPNAELGDEGIRIEIQPY